MQMMIELEGSKFEKQMGKADVVLAKAVATEYKVYYDGVLASNKALFGKLAQMKVSRQDLPFQITGI